MNWKTTKVSGTPQEVKDALAKDGKIPQNVKDFIASEIAGLKKPPTSVTVMAYSADYPGQNSTVRNIQFSLTF